MGKEAQSLTDTTAEKEHPSTFYPDPTFITAMAEEIKWFIHFTGTNQSHPSTEEACNSLLSAHSALVAAYEIEVLFDILLSAYREVEQFGLVNSLRWSTEEQLDNILDIARRRAQANSTVMFALTAQKTYYDQIKRHLTVVCGNTAGKNHFKGRWKALEENIPEMYLVRAIRNHAQHGGMPVTSLRTGHRSDQSEIYTQLIMSTAEAGRDNPDFAKSIEPMIGKIPNNLELMHILRVMIYEIHELHQELRNQLIEPAAKAAVQVIADAVKEFTHESWTQYPLVVIAEDSVRIAPRKDKIVSVGAYMAFERLAQTNRFKCRPISERIVQRLHVNSLMDPHVYPS
jgi:hypothetical protein